MISMAAVTRIRKHYIFMFIITNPVVATFGFGKILCFSAQTATRFVVANGMLSSFDFILHNIFSITIELTRQKAPDFWSGAVIWLGCNL